MVFSVKDLVNYISSGPTNVPPEAMTQLNQLLFKELREYCALCEDDRMICVLSPMCPQRILLKVRIQAGAEYADIPQFCYEQAVNNIRRFFAKKTTLYSPQDELIYTKDFVDILFTKSYKNFTKYLNQDLPKLHQMIEKSKTPAVNLDFRNADRNIFKKIINKDKFIREGTFIYDISGEYLIIWHEGIISIANFQSNIAIINAKFDSIQNLKIIDLVFHIYCAENDLIGFTHLKGEHQMSFLMKIPIKQIDSEWFNPEKTYFQQIIDKFSENFFQIKLSIDGQENFTISMEYRNLSYFLQRNRLSPVSYKAIHDITKLIGKLRILPNTEEE